MKKNLVLQCLLEPIHLNSSCKKTIFNLLKEKYEGNSVNAGYIIKVLSIKEFIHNTISNGNVNIKMLCDCDVFKPIVDNVISCKVDMIHLNGIFVSIHNIKILIPNKNNMFDIRDNVCMYKDKSINIGDYIDIIIKHIRFDNNSYTCIGEIYN